MCRKCLNPESLEYQAAHLFFLNKTGQDLSPTELYKKNKHLKALDDTFIHNNPHFTRETDTMPDGFHAKPRHMWKKVILTRKELKAFGDKQTLDHAEKLQLEYNSLPEPKPNYMNWAVMRSEQVLFGELFRQSMTAQKENERQKAIMTLLEYNKVKPKQAIEISEGIKQGEACDLFRQIGQLAGIPSEAVEAFVGTYFGESVKSN